MAKNATHIQNACHRLYDDFIFLSDDPASYTFQNKTYVI